jgi:diguanylate cyclase (GGDEF)-like protein
MIFKSLLLLIEVLIITVLDYYMASSFYSLDVLYCLPVIQTARFSALQRDSSSGSYTINIVAIACAIAWSFVEALVVWPNFPISAIAMNVLTRAVTFTVIARVVMRLWKDKEHEVKDSLTGLSNRVEMSRKLEEIQEQSEIHGNPHSLLYINIDQFRKFNDEFGHKMGDEVLIQLAKTLQEKTKEEDMVSRIASDEFLILLRNADQKLSQIMGTRLCQAAENAFKENGWKLSVSFGQVTEVGKLKSLDELIRIAGDNLKVNRNTIT